MTCKNPVGKGLLYAADQKETKQNGFLFIYKLKPGGKALNMELLDSWGL